MRKLLGCCRGATVVEFALFAPMVIFGLLATVDIGLSVTTRMELDRNVRAGAQAAMSLNNDAAAIESIVLASAGAPADMSVDAVRSCFCGTTATACSVPCAGGAAPSVFFAIRAARPQSGLIFEERTILSETRVQIR